MSFVISESDGHEEAIYHHADAAPAKPRYNADPDDNEEDDIVTGVRRHINKYDDEEYDDDDDSSIHHDISEEEAERSSIASNTPREPAKASSSLDHISPRPSHKQAANDIPENIQRLLRQWQDWHGNVGPKCATRLNQDELPNVHYDRATGEPSTWIHISGEILQVTTYLVPESLNVQRQGKIGDWRYIVVKGRTLKPSIVRFKSSGYLHDFEDKGALYRIWVGISGDEDGLEHAPTVLKFIKPLDEAQYAPSGDEYSPEPLDISKTRRLSSTRVLAGQPQVEIRPKVNHDLQRKRRRLNEQLDDDDELSDRLSSSTIARVPSTRVKAATPTSRMGEADKSRKGGTRFNCYLCKFNRKYIKDIRSHLRYDHELDDPDFDQIIEYLEEPDPRKQPIFPEPQILPLHTSTSPSSSAVLPQAPAKTSALASRENLSEVDAYIKENTHILFFSPRGQSRTKPLSACDTVHKLFAQARAGDVFDQSEARVLAVQIGDVDRKLPIVENDMDDFDAFTSQLKQAPCWKIASDKIQGTCIVQAREKQ